MHKNDSLSTQDEPGDLNDYPLSVRFATRRALLNADAQAKITEGSYKPGSFRCTRPKSGWLADWLTKKVD